MFKWMSCITLAMLLIVVAEVNDRNDHADHHTEHEWGYSGEKSPEYWGDLSSEFEACKNGQNQSPVNLIDMSINQFTSFRLVYKDSPFEVVNNGHTIQFNYQKGSSLTIEDKSYELLQFHFHSPSEHTVEGQSYPMELHLVHKGQDGQLAVIGVFLKEGQYNPFIQTLWSNIPTQEAKQTIQGIKINASALLPQDKSYYHYSGSLTTPPCTEAVNWYVLKQPIEISSQQISKFQSIYNGNARPVQPLNQRVIETQ